MSKLMLIIALLMVLVIVSQIEWRQPFLGDVDPQKQIPDAEREKVVKEKIILIQEKSIHKLNEAIQNLNKKLKKCACFNMTLNNSTFGPPAEHVTEEQIVDDEFGQQEEVPEN
ncbi:hyaluronan mediated motility receptor-relatedfamily protein [Striga asiatica]|uniref:Hyaluronan mediated motility receptor-relatedfamily protein n=1 Tax=Striga asiatica TaxID=4170 RepID=A0A5A7PK34_STRAF|nr:hyaluronan mediated motility receptor-relatedfamily protein [Striga asiatica]